MKPTLAFHSKLGPCVLRYLNLHFALGYKYDAPIKALRSLDRFVSRLPRNAQDLTAEVFHSWGQSMSALTLRTRWSRMLMIRKFCVYRRRSVPDCFVPDARLFPRPGQTVRPYIFSESEVAALLKTAATLPRHTSSPLRSEVVRLAIVLLYTLGLRVGELLRLVVGDFDRRESTLLVRNSKFHKSRLLPLRQDVRDELKRYLCLRVQHRLPVGPETPLIWNQKQGGKAYTAWGLTCSLWAVLDACSIRTPAGRLPRVHDFRHSCAVNALIRWYRSDADVSTKLPFLAAFLGHVSIISTYRYLHFVEPLRTQASQRFDESYGGLVVPRSEQEAGRA